MRVISNSYHIGIHQLEVLAETIGGVKNPVVVEPRKVLCSYKSGHTGAALEGFEGFGKEGL